MLVGENHSAPKLSPGYPILSRYANMITCMLSQMDEVKTGVHRRTAAIQESWVQRGYVMHFQV